MDSNFKVRITADLSELEKSLGSVKTLLGTVSSTAVTSSKAISSSADTASVSVGNLNKTFQKTNDDSGRARLAAFAFGQVIRDAGFFSQSFGLGLLAISNNIPILIDQLVLLTGISGAAGVAISLIGSALTAGLTAFAYYAQSLARDGKSVGQVFKDMALDSESMLGKLVNYLSSPPASTILNEMIGNIQSGFAEMKSIFRDFVSVAMKFWDSFGNDIMAATSTIFSYITETLKYQLGLSLNIIKAVVALMSGDFSGLADAIGNIFKGIANQIINVLTFIASRGTQIIGSFVGLFDKLGGENIKNAGKAIAQFGNSLKIASTESKSADFNLKNWISSIDIVAPKSKKAADGVKDSVKTIADVYEELRIKLLQIEADTTLNTEESAKKKVSAYRSAQEDIISITKSSNGEQVKSLGELMAKFDSIANQQKNLAAFYKNDPLGQVLASIPKKIEAIAGSYDKLATKFLQIDSVQKDTFFDKAPKYIQAFQATINELLANGVDPMDRKIQLLQMGIANLSTTTEGFNNVALQSAQMLAGPLSGAFEQMLTSGTFSFQALTKIIGDMVKKLIAAALAAFILSTILKGITGGAMGGPGGKGGFKDIFGTISGLKMANGGIASGPTQALIGEYPGAKTNPEVVAPLDKLQGILANTMGGGSQGPSTLQTRISGNDLVILMERANKNRNGYF